MKKPFDLKVCSRMPFLRICRLPFDYGNNTVNEFEFYSLKSLRILSNLFNTNQLRHLSLGKHSSRFLERLLLYLPFIENLSFAVKDPNINENDVDDSML
jgi:hypothetical protein